MSLSIRHAFLCLPFFPWILLLLLPLPLLPLFALLLLCIFHLLSLSHLLSPLSQAVPLNISFSFFFFKDQQCNTYFKKKRRKSQGKRKERKGREMVVKRIFSRLWLQVIPRNHLPYPKIKNPHPCKGSAQAVEIAHTQYTVCDGSYRGRILLGSGAWNNHRWCKPLLTTLRRCSPTLTVHGCNKVLRSSRWQRHSLWALISLWVISLWLQFQPYVYTDALYFARLVYFLSIILRSSCYPPPLSASFWFCSSIFFHEIFKHLTWDLRADDFREPTYSSIQLWGALRDQLLENSFFFQRDNL